MLAYLKRKYIKTLDAVVSTYPDADYVDGLATIITSMKVKSVYAPRVTHTKIAYKNFLTAMKRKKLKIKVAKKGVVIPKKFKNVTVKFSGPIKDYHKGDFNN